MKKLIVAVGLVFLFCGVVQAEILNVTLKQGFIVPWRDAKLQNMTVVETLNTKPIESWGKWNILWDGWSVDTGIAYDAEDVLSTGVVLLGRNFGTLGKYLPINFPLKDQVVITIYPIGIYVSDLNDSAKFTGCYGGAFVNVGIKF
jgi:hypothetical protein